MLSIYVLKTGEHFILPELIGRNFANWLLSQYRDVYVKEMK